MRRALALAQQAVDLHEQILDLDDLDRQDLLALKLYCDARDQRAWTYGQLGEFETGLRELRATLKIRRRSVERCSVQAGVRRGLERESERGSERDYSFDSSVAHSLMICASLHQKCGESNEALACAQEALAVRRQLVAHRAHEWPLVAQCLSSIAVSFQHLGDDDGACEAALESLGILWSLAEADQRFVWAALDGLRDAGMTLWSCGRTEEAIAHQLHAATIYEALLRDTVVDVRRSLAVVYQDLGEFYLATNLDESIRYGLLSIEQYRLSLDGTSSRELRLATALIQLALRYDRHRATGDARPLYEEAIRIFCGQSLIDPSKRRDLVRCHRYFALSALQDGDFDAAKTQCERALELAQALVDEQPDDCGYVELLALVLRTHGDVLADAGFAKQALEQTRLAVERLRPLVLSRKGLLPSMGFALKSLRLRLDGQGLHAEALSVAMEEDALWSAIVSSGNTSFLPNLVSARRGRALYSQIRSDTARALAASGQFVEALAEQRLAITLMEPLVRADASSHEVVFAEQFVDLGKRLADVGQGALGLVPTDHAVTILRARMKMQPGACLKDLACALAALGDRHLDCGNLDCAQKAWHEAEAIQRGL